MRTAALALAANRQVSRSDRHRSTTRLAKPRCFTHPRVDHEALTFLYGGRNHRLTDVHGRVITGILA
ncbi:MAG: hypothetical protein IPK26_18325 [Planctomycetes bacterium]|nr:hypothetical protein [Planctomycetota bacterium]